MKVGTFGYTYDPIGNLATDNEEGTSIKWTVYGKISEVTKADGKIVKYRYDGTGNRAVKMLYTNASTLFKTTYYLRDASGNVMAIYEQAATQATTQTLIEQPIYGSSRIGIYKAPDTGSVQFKLTLGYKQYELSNHLSNTLITISDNKIGVAANNANLADLYEARVLSATDYYAFGMSMKGRTWQNEKYRYGFNGKENDSDWDVQDYGFRIYKPELGKFLSVDPITAEYPELTPYQFASNTPIEAIDLDGLERRSTKYSDHAINMDEPKLKVEQAIDPIYRAKKSPNMQAIETQKYKDYLRKNNLHAYDGGVYKSGELAPSSIIEDGIEAVLTGGAILTYKGMKLLIRNTVSNFKHGVYADGVQIIKFLGRESSDATMDNIARQAKAEVALFYRPKTKQYIRVIGEEREVNISALFDKGILKDGDEFLSHTHPTKAMVDGVPWETKWWEASDEVRDGVRIGDLPTLEFFIQRGSKQKTSKIIPDSRASHPIYNNKPFKFSTTEKRIEEIK